MMYLRVWTPTRNADWQSRRLRHFFGVQNSAPTAPSFQRRRRSTTRRHASRAWDCGKPTVWSEAAPSRWSRFGRQRTAETHPSCGQVRVIARRSVTAHCPPGPARLPPCAVTASTAQQCRPPPTTPSHLSLSSPPPASVARKFNAVYYRLKFDADCRSDRTLMKQHLTAPGGAIWRSSSLTISCILQFHNCRSPGDGLCYIRTIEWLRRWLGLTHTFSCHVWCVAAFAERRNRIRHVGGIRLLQRLFGGQATDACPPEHCVPAELVYMTELPQLSGSRAVCQSVSVKPTIYTRCRLRPAWKKPTPTLAGKTAAHSATVWHMWSLLDESSCVVCYFIAPPPPPVPRRQSLRQRRSSKRLDTESRFDCAVVVQNFIYVTRHPKYTRHWHRLLALTVLQFIRDDLTNSDTVTTSV